jgi:thioredoxin 1
MTSLNRENFEKEVLMSELPVLVDFWGPNCRPCLALMPAVETLASERQGRLKVCKVDASQNRRLCLSLRVMGLPSFLLYNHGVEIGRISGENLTFQNLCRWMENTLGERNESEGKRD